jgi:hypothetical protein
MPQRIDVPGMGIVEFPDGMSDDDMAAAIQRNMPAPAGAEPQGPPDERSFLDKAGSKVGSFLNPPPTVAGVRDIIKGAPQAASELTWGADPQAAEQAAGTMLGAAGLGLTGARALQFPAAAAAPAAPAATTATTGALEAANRLGIGVPQFLATEGRAVPMMAAGVKNVPWAGEPIIRAEGKLIEDLGAAKAGMANAAATPETAGQVAGQGLTGFIKGGSKAPVSAAYDAVDAMVNPQVRLPLTHTTDTVAQLLAERQQARIPGRSKAIDTVFDAMQDPSGLDYAGTKGLRSHLGEKTPQELVVSGVSPVEHKRLYAALTKDLGNVVLASGGPEALAAWQKANALSRLTNMQREALAKVVGREGTASPEAVFSRLMSYAGSKSSADLQRLRLAKQAMGSDAWEHVSSAVINRLGMAPDGSFSPDRFVTAFGNLSPRGRGELFSPQQHAALMDLNTVSQYARDRISRLGNPSGTARGLIGGLGVSHLITEPVSAIASLVGTRLAAEALSRPRIVRAVTTLTRAQMTGNPRLTQRALQHLYHVGMVEGLVSIAPSDHWSDLQ